MLRLFTLAAAAAALATSAGAAESIHVRTTGKSADQVRTEVEKAALYLCRQQVAGTIVETHGPQACVRRTVLATLKQAAQPGPAGDAAGAAR